MKYTVKDPGGREHLFEASAGATHVLFVNRNDRDTDGWTFVCATGSTNISKLDDNARDAMKEHGHAAFSRVFPLDKNGKKR